MKNFILLVVLALLITGCNVAGDYMGSATAVNMGWVEKPHGRIAGFDVGARELQEIAGKKKPLGSFEGNIGRIINISLFSMEPLWGIIWLFPDIVLDLFSLPWTKCPQKK